MQTVKSFGSTIGNIFASIIGGLGYGFAVVVFFALDVLGFMLRCVVYLGALFLGLLAIAIAMFAQLLGYLIAIVIASALGIVPTGFKAICYGIALAQLWAWFIVDAFNVALIPLPLAVGVALLVSLMTAELHAQKDEPSALRFYLAAMARPMTALMVGFILNHFV